MTHRGRGSRGVAFAYVGMVMFTLLVIVGLAVDLGRAYVVRGNLAKAVDAAALAAARQIGSGRDDAIQEAIQIFRANFPLGYLGVSSVHSPPDIRFTLADDGSNVTTVASSATLPTTFMRVAGFPDISIRAQGQSTRRLVDMVLLLDHSLSIGAAYARVQAAAQDFVRNFDRDHDRLALVLFASSTIVMDPIRPGRGFDQASILNHIQQSPMADGGTGTAEGLYAAWDQLRSVHSDARSGLRTIVLFTDGSPNTFSATFQVKRVHNAPDTDPLVTRTGSIHAYDYPRVNDQGRANPSVVGLYESYGSPANPAALTHVAPTDGSYTSIPAGSPYTNPNYDIPNLPPVSAHPIRGFKLYDPSLSGQRGLIGATRSGYPDNVLNASRAARNLAESVANAAREDDEHSQPIRIYTLGLGDLLNHTTSDPPETGASILQRIANDPASASFDPSQPEGRYFFAGDPDQLDAAFRQIRDQLIRISE